VFTSHEMSIEMNNLIDFNPRTKLFYLFSYGEGSRKLSILHARLRHQCNSLNSDLYRINITNDPKCQCGAPYEDSIHYLMECPLYQNERYCLSTKITHTQI
jgi:hypothetical protein